MDWYAWLCRAGLHPDVAFEYALLFARAGLATAADLRRLDHHSLSAIGVPIAKHRLHILNLANHNSSSSASSSSSVARLPWRATLLLAAAARSLAARLRSVAVAPRPLWMAPPSRKKMAALMMRQLSKPMLTNYNNGGGKRKRKTAKGAAPAITGCFANNTDAHGYSDDDEEYNLYDLEGDDMRWESMFQDLNPT